jgi:hypothetical protein
MFLLIPLLTLALITSVFLIAPLGVDRLADRTVCLALSPPDAVFSRPPRAVAPSPPTLVIRPELSRVRRFGPRLTFFAAGLPPELPPPPAKRPRLSRL